MNAKDPSPKKSALRAVLFVFVGGVLLAGAAVLTWRLFFSGPRQPHWLTQKVTRGNVLQVVSATGTLQPTVLSPVGAQVSGIVWKIHADYNDLVKKGQVLVELDPALFEAAVRQQTANLISAQAALAKARSDAVNARVAATRARALAAKNYIALSDRDTAVAAEASANAAVIGAEAGIKLAQAALDQAQLNLKNSVILSPVDGVVIARNVELGQAVVASFQAPNIFTIAEDLAKMQVLANVDEADIGHVRVGETAEFTVDAFRGRRFHGRVGQIRNAPQTVSNVVTYIVVIDVNNKDLLLRPGMTANVRLEVARRKDALIIPSSALRFKPRLDQMTAPPPGSGQGGGAGGGGEGRHGGWGRHSGEWREGRGRGAANPDGGASSGRGGDGENPDGGAFSGREGHGGGNSGEFLERGTPATVYVPSGEEVTPVSIVVGITDGMVTEVKEGLNEGQSIVVDAFKGGGGGGGPGGPGGPRPGGGGGFRRGGF